MRGLSIAFAGVVLCLSGVVAQEALKSGPAPGTVLPGPFDAFNINGKVAEGRQHCLICQNALNPAVLIFTREPAAKTEKPLTDLLEGLDKLVAKHQSVSMGGFTFVLSKDARSSVTEAEEQDTDKLLEEATKFRELVARLKKRAEPLKNVVIATFPEPGPKGYNIHADAEVTVVFYSKMKVIANWAFAKEALADNDVAAILKKVDESMLAARDKK